MRLITSTTARPAAALAATVVLTLAACGSDGDTGGDADAAASATTAASSEPDGGSDAEGLPNACPVEGCSLTIIEAETSGDEIQLTLEGNFTPDFERNHMHIFWDSQEAGAVSSDFQAQGFEEQGKWHPTDEFPVYVTQADASVASEFREGSTTLCVTAADTDHAVIDASVVHCLDVSEHLNS